MAMSASQSNKRAKKRPSNRYHGRIEHADGRLCDWPGCKEPGEFKAPIQGTQNGDGPPQWRWFCLEHVREYNEKWNYFDSLSPEEFANVKQAHPSWDGPTFPFRMNPDDLAALKMKDTHGIFQGDGRFRRFADSPRGAQRPRSSEEAMALSTLGLPESASGDDIKKRYKALLKQYHPDANGGDRKGEKKMQAVISAYHQLMDGQQSTR